MATIPGPIGRKPVEQSVAGALSTSISIKTSQKHDLVGHRDTVMSFVFLQDDVHIVSGSDDGTMRKWNCDTGLLVGEPWKVYNAVVAMALSPDGKTIACGRDDGSVQRWDTNGQAMEGIWTGHGGWVRSLTWSPDGSQFASGSEDGIIIIRKSESGKVQGDPIKTNQGWVWSVAYSPSGEKIASGGTSTCIWDANTGDLLVGPIEGWAFSVVWSLDGSKLYSAGQFARVLDSTSSTGTELRRFHVDNSLLSIALSPKQNLLAGVGLAGVAQIWNTESYQPLGQLFHHRDNLRYVSFSPDGRYLAYGRQDNKITLMMVEESVLEHPFDAIPEDPLESLSQPPEDDAANSLAHSAVDTDDGPKNPYEEDFFRHSHSSLPLPPPNNSHMRRVRRIFSRPPINRFTRPRVPHFLRRTPTNLPLQAPAHMPTSRGKSRAATQGEASDDVNPLENAQATTRCGKGKGRESPVSDKLASIPPGLHSPDELDNDENHALFNWLHPKMGGRKAPAKVTQDRTSRVAVIYAVRPFKRLVSHKQKRRTTSLAQKPGIPTTPAGADGSSQAGPSSQAGSPSQGHVESTSQYIPTAVSAGGSRPDSCSDSSVQSPCIKFLEWICLPRGRYDDEGA